MSYLDERRAFIEAGRPLKEKKVYRIPHKSKKRIEKEEEQRQPMNENDLKEKWFSERKKDLVGTCQCGCGMPSQKNDRMYFRHSIAHIFPKKDFKSVMFHPLNFVERAFFGGCHGKMDDTSIERWVNMADWDDIKAKFLVLEPLLYEDEKKKKFYHLLKSLVQHN